MMLCERNCAPACPTTRQHVSPHPPASAQRDTNLIKGPLSWGMLTPSLLCYSHAARREGWCRVFGASGVCLQRRSDWFWFELLPLLVLEH